MPNTSPLRYLSAAVTALLLVAPVHAAVTAQAGAAPAAEAPAAAVPASDAAARPYGGRPWTSPIPRSAALDHRSAGVTRYLAGSGAVADLYAFGVPVFTATGRTPRYTVHCTAPWGRCPLERQRVPITDNARPASGSDGAMAVVDASAGKVFEFWQARRAAGRWTASWGAVNAVTGTPLGGATGAAIPLLSGLIRLSDIQQGHIDHALTFSSANACSGSFRYPALKTDGRSSRPDCIPEGARLRLDPKVNVDAIRGMTPAERIIAKALQRYGAYCRDRGGARMAIVFEVPAGKPDPYPAAGLRWDYKRLTNIPWHRIQLLRSWNG